MKAIVTGGSGFIGTNLVSRLKELGADVLSLDILPPRNISNLSVHRYCDICDPSQLTDCFLEFKPDYVFHLAARTDLAGKSLEDYAVNMVGVQNVCDVVSSTESVRHAVFASSMLVCRVGYVPVDIDDVCPSTLYGESKVQGERIVRFRPGNTRCSIVRPTSIWGAWFSEPYKNFFDIVLAGKYIRIGQKSSTKTYGYVENAVNQILSIGFSERASAQYYYIGDEPPINVDDWALEIAGVAGLRSPRRAPMLFFRCLALVGDIFSLVGIKFPFSSFRLKNMTTDNVIDCGVAAKINSYPAVARSVGVQRTLAWLKSNK